MTPLARWANRGYSRLALLLVLATSLSAYAVASLGARSARAAAVVRVANPRAARVSHVGAVTYVASPDAPARIVLDTVPPDDTRPLRLLWLAGHQAGALQEGSIALDAGGGIVEFDQHLRPHRRSVAAQGRSMTEVADAGRGGLWLADDAGHVIRTNARGDVISDRDTPFRYPALATSGTTGRLWLVRSPTRFGYAWDSTGSALLARVTDDGTVDKRVGRAAMPAHVMLQDLANSGRVAVRGGIIYFAPFIRDEIVALDTLGDTLWVASRDLPQSTREPKFEVENGRVVVDYHPVNLGITFGPDGRLYVLSTPGATTLRARLDAFDPSTGRLLRSVELSNALPTLAVDTEGRVYLLDATRLLTGVAPRERETFPRVDFASRSGARVTTDQFHGRVTVVSIWASWCTVCRVELPALESMRHTIGDSAVAFVSINADRMAGSADRLLRELNLRVDYALGGPTVSTTYSTPGLPFTVLLDREGRVVQRWAGFTGPEQLETIRAAIQLELETGRQAEGHTHHQSHGSPS